MTLRQHQVLAQEKTVKPAANKARDEAYHLLQRESAFNGQSKRWEKINEESPVFPDEDVKVQAYVTDVLANAKASLIEWFNIEATKNETNGKARADIVVDNETILKDVCATTLLFLEQQVAHAITMLDKAPVLDDAVRWNRGDGGGPARSDVQRTARTAKLQKPLVLYPATDKHPAQTQLITEDVIIGHWVTEKLSGALSRDQKTLRLERANKLLSAIREARSRANMTEATEVKVGKALFEYLGW